MAIGTTEYPRCVVCGKPLRPKNMAAAVAPETVAKGYGGKCKSDSRKPPVPAPIEESALDPEEDTRFTLLGLELFIAERYARGVDAERRSPIRYRPEILEAA